MGRGNSCVHGKFEGLYYVDWDNFPYEIEDEEGNVIVDYYLKQDLWDESLYLFLEDMKKRFPSMRNINKWLSNEKKLFWKIIFSMWQ